jgi:predicted nucleic acid-binding protein
MPIYFLDSSAVVKHYHPEPGSEEVSRILHEPSSRFYISRLAVVEVHRAFAGKARINLLSADELVELRHYFYGDLRGRRFRVKRFYDFHFHAAVRLVLKHGPALGTPLLRSLDALHLAVALDIRAREGLDFFVCADKDLCTIAEAEQLSVFNPTA